MMRNHERPKSIPEDIISIIDDCLDQYRLTPEEASVLEQSWLDRGELPEYVAIGGIVKWYDHKKMSSL